MLATRRTFNMVGFNWGSFAVCGWGKILLTNLFSAVKLIIIMKVFFTKGRRKAISKNAFDFAKVIMAALFLGEFVKFPLIVKVSILLGLIGFVAVGITVCPDSEGDD